MSATQNPGQESTYRQISGAAESVAAIGDVIASARRTLCIFDYTLAHRGFGDPGRIEKLRSFLLAGRAHRLRIALHETEQLERHEPRLLVLLRQLPASISIHRTIGQARSATDPFVLADDHSVWHQLHHDQARAVVALHSPQNAAPLAQRFDEIWDLSEPAISATKLGL
jgi:hypothetical protein